MPSDEQEVLEQNRRAHDAFAEEHDRVASHIAKPGCRSFYEGLFQTLRQRLNLPLEGAAILELGCGTGNWAEYFLAQGVSAYHGIDVSPGMIEAARRKCLDPRATFRATAVETCRTAGADSGPQEFDVLFSFSFLHHLYDLERFFHDAARLLKPGGVYIALHEPLLRDFDFEKRSLGEIVDSILGTIAGWDQPALPWSERAGALCRMARAKLLPAAATVGAAPAPNLIDYQLNQGNFSPASLQRLAGAAGLQASSYLYSYYRFPLLRPLFGATKNHFAMTFHRSP